MPKATIKNGEAWIEMEASVGHLTIINEALIQYAKLVESEKLDVTPQEAKYFQDVLDKVEEAKLHIKEPLKEAEMVHDSFIKNYFGRV